MTAGPAFPFSAVVGQDGPKVALVLAAIDPSIGGVLLRGQKGSGKTTLARGLAALLPGDAPFVDLPVGATEDRVAGTIDLRAALTDGERRFQPGLLAAADGGVLYVDEVNLLPDHLVDLLLDVAASGVNRVEREGVSESHPSRFVLVGSMNPEEGDLRPQLLDRFGLAIDVTASGDPDERALAVRRRMAFDADPQGFAKRWAAEEGNLRRQVGSAAAGAASDAAADAEPELVKVVSALCAHVGAEGLRADLVICRAARALAAWEGRQEATTEDVRRVAGLALAHRARRTPFEEPGVDQDRIDEALGRRPAQGFGSSAGARGERGGEGAGTAGATTGAGEPEPAGDAEGGGPGDRGVRTAPAMPGAPGGLAPAPRASRRGPAPGPQARGRHGTEKGPRGRLVGDRVPGGPPRSVALGGTVTAVAARRSRGDGGEGLQPGDVREAVREQRVANLVVVAVDASGSMGARRRMEAAKSAVLALLLDAYQRRDRVAMIVFRGDSAEVVLRPTGSVEVARARLAELQTGGRTPLAEGIDRAASVAEAAGGYRPLMVLLSDGRATGGRHGTDPVGASLDAALRVRRRGLDAVVVDAEDGPVRLGLAAGLAEHMGARHVMLEELSGPALAGAVREALGASLTGAAELGEARRR